MNKKLKADTFLHRVLWYVLITAVIQFLLGIGFAFTAFAPGLVALIFLIPMSNFAYLLLMLFHSGFSYTQYGYLMAAGTLFMFLIVVALGEIHRRITKMTPSDPLEEARRASYE